MKADTFQPFFDHILKSLEQDLDETLRLRLLDELWQQPWDKVLQNYGVAEEKIHGSLRVLDEMELHLDISPYPDYAFVQQLSCKKFLVTTSLTSLQEKKIKALNIAGDFDKIVINDRFKELRNKRDIFEALQQEYALDPGKTIVVGDSSESEIEAGNRLGMITVQILREGVRKGNNALHYIYRFDELSRIMNL